MNGCEIAGERSRTYQVICILLSSPGHRERFTGGTQRLPFHFSPPRVTLALEPRTFKASASEKLMSFHLPLRAPRETKREERQAKEKRGERKKRGSKRITALLSFVTPAFPESLRQI